MVNCCQSQVQAPTGSTIRLQFIYLDINSTFEWIKIRNGKQPNSDLLEQFSSGKRLDVLQSTSNEVVLQFHTLMDDGIGDGFIVQITALMHELASTHQELLLAMKDKKLTANSVHTLGLAIFGALFCTAALCAVLQWLNWSKFAYFTQKKIPVSHGSIQEFQLMERATLLSYVSDTTESSELWEPLIQDTKVQLRSHHSREYMNKRDAFSMLSPPVQEDQDSGVLEECTGAEETSGKVRFKKEVSEETTKGSQFSQKPTPKIAHSNQASKSGDKNQLGKKLPVATVSPQPARALIKKNKQKELLEIENTEFTEKYSLNDNFKRRNESCRGPRSEESSFVTLKTSDKTINKKENIENLDKKVSKVADVCSAPTSHDQTSQIVSYKRAPEQENSAMEDKDMKQEKSGSSQEINSSALEIENDFEYDYYDYNVHYDPGSVFSREPAVVSWLPPFIPRLSSRSQLHEMDEISNAISKDT